MADKKEQETDDLLLEARNFTDSYKKEIGKSIREGKKVIFIDFKELASFSHQLAEEIIEKPGDTIQLLETAVEESGLVNNPTVRLRNLPKTYTEDIRDLRASHLNKLVQVEGIVRQASEVRPQVVNAKFECPSCGTVISVLQVKKKFKTPNRCSCGRKGNFKLLNKDMVDAQRLVVEETPESLIGGEQPRRVNVFLKKDLTEPKMEKRTTPGSKIRLIGVLKEIPITSRTGKKLTRSDIALEANNIIPLEETFEELDINEEEERQIKELAASKDVLQKFIKSITPSIHGYDEIKKALALQMFGGVRKERSDGTSTRGDIHILLVGDPGTGKSVNLKYIGEIAPKGRYLAGKSSTGAGITATVVRDEYLKGWSLEAGAMVLSNMGIVCMTPNNNIIVDNKSIPIKNLFEENKKKTFYSNGKKVEVCDLDCKVPALGQSLNFENATSSKIRRKHFEGEVLEITLDSGFSLTLTPDHQLIDGNSLDWKQAQEFGKGDYLLSPLKLPSKNSELYILDILPQDWIVCLDKEEKKELESKVLEKYENILNFKKKFNIKKRIFAGKGQLNIGKFREILKKLNLYQEWKKKKLKYGRSKKGERLKVAKVTPSLAYFLGFVYGDGSVRVNKKHSRLEIVQSTKNKKQIKRVRKNFQRFSSNQLNEYKRTMNSEIRGEKVNSETLSLYTGSNLLAYLYNYLTKQRLSNILTLPDESIKGFIGGCMDSDGCISIKNSKKKGKNYQIAHIEFLLSNNSRECKNLMLALRRLDCYSKLIEEQPISRIRITGRKDVRRLLNLLENYSVKVKDIPTRKTHISSTSGKLPQKPIQKISSEIIQQCKNTKELNKLELSSTLYNYKNGKRRPSRQQLSKIKDKLNFISNQTRGKINTLLKRDFFLDKIKKVKRKDYSGYVYDLFVPRNHNFICEGTVAHNCIDELEKMGDEDRSSIHEGMEQQSYHPETEVTLANGETKQIAGIVDERMKNNKDKIVNGKNCQILPVEDLKVQTTDFEKIFETKVDRISRHSAPGHFIQIKYKNGRKIRVTPEHPVFVYENGKIKTKRADKVREGELVPVPKENNKNSNRDINPNLEAIPITNVERIKNKGEKWVYDLTVEPTRNFISEGLILHNTITVSKANVQACYSEDTEVLTEKGWKKYNEVGDLKIAQYDPSKNTIKFLPHKGLYLYDYNQKMYHFKNERNDILVTPDHTMLAKKENREKFEKINAQDIKSRRVKFLNSGEYEGKGKKYFSLPAIKHKQNRARPRYTHQHQEKKIPMDLWLEFLGYYITEGGIETAPTIGITQKKGDKASKIKRCMKKLTNQLGCSLSEVDAGKYMKFKITQTQLHNYLKESGENYSVKKLGLDFSSLSKKQLKILYKAMMLGDGSSDGKYFSSTSKELIDEFQTIAHLIGKSASQHIHYPEGTRGRRKMFRVSLSDRTQPSIKKKSVKKVNYDGKVFCFSTQTGFFVTRRNGKIAIQGNTLQAKTSVLAAANPKLGRFDPYQTVANQIELSSTLINRFDVIFIMKDNPDKKEDEAIAEHVLKEHQQKDKKPPIEKDLLRKYVAYAKQSVFPKITNKVREKIKDFYVNLRNQPSKAGEEQPVPISARQLEALIRLSEAHARVRLSDKVEEKDAEVAIDLMKYYLQQVGYDYETKSFDIDRVATGVSTSERGRIRTVKETLSKLESRLGKLIPVDELKKELEGEIDEDKIDEALQKLSMSGEIFHPKKGHIQKM